MIVPFTHMNQFVYAHSLDHKRPARNLLINEAFDVGLFPVGNYFHFGLIEFDSFTREMTITVFKKDRDRITRHIKDSKATDMILFRYNPYAKEVMGGIDLDKEPLVVISDEEIFKDKFFFMGDVMIPSHKEYTKFFKSLGVQLKRLETPDAEKEMFLAQFALIDRGTLKLPLFKSEFMSASYIVVQYDCETPNEEGQVTAQIEKLTFGCNNDKLLVRKNSKFLVMSSRYSGERGTKDRKGSVMGGNSVTINFKLGSNGVSEVGRLFIPPYNRDAWKGKYQLVKPWDVLPKTAKLDNWFTYDEKKEVYMADRDEPIPPITNEEINAILHKARHKTPETTSIKSYYRSQRVLVKAEDAETARIVIFK